MFEVLRRCKLFLPKDIEESTADEDIEIILKPLVEVNYHRTLVGSKYKHPLTLTLLGADTQLIGVRVTLYSPTNVGQQGIYFIVNSALWEFTAKEMDEAPKKKDYQKDDLADYSWLPSQLTKKGYKTILEKIKVQLNDKGDPSLSYTGKNGPTMIDYLENIFPNQKKTKNP